MRDKQWPNAHYAKMQTGSTMAQLRRARKAFIAAVKQFPWRLVFRLVIGAAIVIFTGMPGLAALLFAGLMNYIDDLTKKIEEAYAELPEEKLEADAPEYASPKSRDAPEYAPPKPSFAPNRRNPSRIWMVLRWVWRLLAVLSVLYLLVGFYGWLIYGR